MKVYIVTEGCYSDYHIEAVFSSEDQACAYIHSHPQCNEQVCVYEVDKSFERKPSIFCVKFKYTDEGIFFDHFDVYSVPDNDTNSKHVGCVTFDQVSNKLIFFVKADSSKAALDTAARAHISTIHRLLDGLFEGLFNQGDTPVWYEIETGKQQIDIDNER